MSRWFRFYDDVINDPKVLKLPDSAYRGWIGLLCVASKHKGILPPTDHLAIYLRIKQSQVAALLAQLVAAGLIDKREDGTLSPHNWDGRQFQSDGSAERVKRHREKRAAAGLQSQWTAPKALRQAVYERDGHKCVYCGGGERLSLDHRTPEIRGGTHDIDNLATACLSCNGAKRDMTETEYRDSVTLLKRRQSTEADNRTEYSEAIASDAKASDPRTRLFNEGLAKLASLTGKGPDACRSFVGKCLKAAGDDAVVVLGLIEDAERNRVVDPSAWIAARLKGPQNGKSGEVSAACDSLIDKLNAGFGGAASQEHSGGGTREIDARLLSYGRG